MFEIYAVDVGRAREFLEKVYDGELCFPESPVTPALVELNMTHSRRVVVNACKIARGEGLDENFLALAAMLHDVAKLDHNDRASGGIDTWHHHFRGAAIAKKFVLQELKKPAYVAEKISKIIDRHSCIPFIDHYWQKNYGCGVPVPQTKLEIALRDADTLDQLGIGGPHKIVHFRQMPGTSFYAEDSGDIQKAIASAEQSFKEAAGVIQTRTGKGLAEEYVAVATKFFAELKDVKDLAEFDSVYAKFMP